MDCARIITRIGDAMDKAPDKINRGIAIIIYSDPGIGKTTLASTLPVDETLIVGCEAGIGPLLGTGHYYFDVNKAITNTNSNIETVMNNLYRDIRSGHEQYKAIKYVVVDNVSELLDKLTIHYTEIRRKDFPELKERGDASYKMVEWIVNCRDLVDIGINVIFNAWENGRSQYGLPRLGYP